MAINPTGQSQIDVFLNLKPKIMELAVRGADPKSRAAFACVSWEWNTCCEDFWNARYENLIILDAKKQEIVVDDEPPFNEFLVRKYLKHCPNVEGGGGFALLTMCKETILGETLRKLISRGIAVKYADFIMSIMNHSTPDTYLNVIDKTYRVIISNGFSVGTKNNNYSTQFNFLKEHGYQAPSFHQYLNFMACCDREKCFFGKPGNEKLAITSTKYVEVILFVKKPSIEEACMALRLNCDSGVSLTRFDDKRCLEEGLPSEYGSAISWVLPYRPPAQIPKDDCTIF